MAAPTPMTAAELIQHPEFPHTTWDLKPSKKDIVAVAKDRGGPINISYEVHGHGNRHLVWIMGLGGYKNAWQRQTKHFAHTKGDKYASLIFDNRGIGDSDKPSMRYSTSEMAKDVVELIDHVGWTGRRELHVIGISMGGMIAQELGVLIPDRICTLNLVSTASGLFNTIGFIENLRNRANMFIPRHIDVQLANIKRNICSETWPLEPDCLASESVVQPFPTNGDRLAAAEIAKRSQTEKFTKKGFLLQAIAAGWHYKSPAQLKELAEKIGKRRIMVVHGTKDNMITFPHGVVLWRGLEKGEGRTGRESWGEEVEKDAMEQGDVEKKFVKGQGHIVPIEMREDFAEWSEALWERGEKMNEEQVITR